MNGYTRIPHELMRNPHLPPIAKVVWSLIAGMAPGFNATLPQFCKMVACHPDTWRRTVKALERFGMISVEHSPNGVAYTAVTDTSKWDEEGMKNSHPIKKTQGMKISHPKGMKISEGKGMKISHPSEEHKKNNKNNNIVDDARARMREEVMTDMMVETGCRSCGITVEQYRTFAAQIFADWEFRDLPASEWNRQHFLSVLRIKARNNNGNNGQPDQSGTRAGRLAASAALIARLGEEERHTAR